MTAGWWIFSVMGMLIVLALVIGVLALVAGRSNDRRARRLLPTPSILLAGTALFIALGGSAVAARGLIVAADIAPGAVTGRAIRNGAVEPRDLNSRTRALLVGSGRGAGANGDTGAVGSVGASGAAGLDGTNGPNGANGADGAKGSNGANGTDGTNGVDGLAGASGSNGANGPNGANGVDGTNGVDGLKGADGTNGTNGTNGTDGTNGTIAPLSAKQGLTALPTAAPPTAIVELVVPPGNYVVFAKTDLSLTGAGDSVECFLKSGTTTVDQGAMKTLPALAAIPASLQAVITTTASQTQLSVQCFVSVANGSANFTSLIAIPTA